MRCVAAMVLTLAFAAMSGCEVDSFFDPSKTGRFEFEPTTIPVLERLDVIEPQEDFWARAEPPGPEDLRPRDLAYHIYPGDVVTVSIFELTQPNMWYSTTRRVDASGLFRVPEIGDVQAAGLTAQQFENEIKRLLEARIMQRPQVDVVVEASGGLRYTVYGFVARTGQYNLDQPNLRLLEALASAGGVPVTTERVFVVRQVILSPEVQPRFQRDQPEPLPRPGDQPSDDERSIEDLIRELENPQNQPRPDTRPGMMQESQDQPPPVDIDDLQPPVEGSEPIADDPDFVDIEDLEPVRAPQPPVDVEELEPVRSPEQPPVDVDVVRPPTPSADDAQDSFIYIPERGEWVRVPAGQRNGAPPPLPAADDGVPSQPPAALSRVLVIDYQRLFKGDSTQNIVVRPGDSIYVDGPPQGFIYVEGEVARIGVYNLPAAGRMTLSRAIAAAGGFGPIAIPSRVDLTRKVGHNREATIRLDLAAIRQRTEPDVMLKPDDHIIVGTTWYATPLAIVRNGFRATYGFGFLLDRNFGNDVFGAPPGFTF